MIFTGMATDFNSGLLLIVMALGVWTRQASVKSATGRSLSAAAGDVGVSIRGACEGGASLLDGAYAARAHEFVALLGPHAVGAREHPDRALIVIVANAADDGCVPVR